MRRRMFVPAKLGARTDASTTRKVTHVFPSALSVTACAALSARTADADGLIGFGSQLDRESCDRFRVR